MLQVEPITDKLRAFGWRAVRVDRIVPIALPDEFLAAGALPTLHDRYGLSADSVVARVKAELGGGSVRLEQSAESRGTQETAPPGAARSRP